MEQDTTPQEHLDADVPALENDDKAIVLQPPLTPQRSRLSQLSKVLERSISNGCANLASYVAYRPNRTIAITVICCLVCAVGWLNVDDEEQVEKLYTPQNTRAFDDRDWVEDNFGDAPWPSTVYLNRRGSDTSVLTKEALLEAFDLYEVVLTVDSDKHRRGYDERSCEAVYWRREGIEPVSPDTTCQKEGVLAFWDWNRTKLEQDPDVLATINRQDKVDCCSPSDDVVSLDSIVGKFRFNDPDDPSKVTGAGALRFVFYLDTHLNRKSRIDPNVYRLMNKFSDRVRDQSFKNFERPLSATVWDFSESSNDAFDSDRAFINFAIILIVIYAFCALYSWRDADRSRGSLGLVAVATVLLSSLAAFGIAIGLGVQFSPSTGVAIFLVLGIGLDDAFVIVGAVDDPFEDEEGYDPSLSPLENDASKIIQTGASVEDVAAKRIIYTLRGAGPSITVTSVTDAAAFIAGSFVRCQRLVDTPDISAFNRFCAVSVLVDFVMQLTFFVALFTLDQRRRLTAKVEDLKRRQAGIKAAKCCSRTPSCCCALRIPAQSRVAEDTADDEANRDESNDEDVAPVKKAIDDEDGHVAESYTTVPPASEAKERYENPEVRFWGYTYANALLSPVGKILTLASAAALLALAIVGSVRIDMDIEDNWGVVTYPALRALNFQDKHFGSGTMQVGVYTKRLDYFEKRQEFYDMLEDYADLNFVIPSSIENHWYAAYDEWLVATNQSNANYDEWLVKLKNFLSTDGVGYSTKVVIDDRGVAGTQVDTTWISKGAFGADGKRRMRKARKEVRGTPLGTVIVYEADFIWNESFQIILPTTLRAIIGAAVTVLVILILLLGDLAAAVIVACAVGFVCISTLGAIYWYNDGLNYITSFFIVIAVGLSADAPAHVMHAYLDSRAPTRKERARESLQMLGPSVFKGGFSTVLGIVITGACITYIFQSFFRYLLTILILALYMGLAVMPVVCSLIGPMPMSESATPIKSAVPSE